MRNLYLCLLLILCASCSVETPSITAYTEYIGRKDLASFYVGTPDPAESCPTVGQRLRVKWLLPKAYLNGQELVLKIRIRFYNQEEVVKEVPITHPWGAYEFAILNEDFFCKNGILAFHINLFCDGEVMDTWMHQLWVEKIDFTTEEIE